MHKVRWGALKVSVVLLLGVSAFGQSVLQPAPVTAPSSNSQPVPQPVLQPSQEGQAEGQGTPEKGILTLQVPKEDIDTIEKMAISDEGQVAVVGQITRGVLVKGGQPSRFSYYLSIYDRNQQMVRDLYTNLEGDAFIKGLVFDQDSNVYIAGHTAALPGGSEGEAVFVKQIKPDGSAGWTYVLDGNRDEQAVGVTTDVDNNIYVLIKTLSDFQGVVGGHDVVVAKINPQGKRVWQKQLGTPSEDQPVAIGVAFDGHVYVTFNSRSAKTQSTSGTLVKLSASGKEITREEFDTPGLDAFSDMLVDDRNDRVFVVGRSDGSFLQHRNAGGMDGMLWQFTTKLKLVRVVPYATPHPDTINAVGLMGDGSVIIGGTTEGKGAERSQSINAFLGVVRDWKVHLSKVWDSGAIDNLSTLVVQRNGSVWFGGSVYANSDAGERHFGWLGSVNRNLENYQALQLQPVVLKTKNTAFRSGLF